MAGLDPAIRVFPARTAQDADARREAGHDDIACSLVYWRISHMPLPNNHPTLKEAQVECDSSSIGTAPVTAYARAPFRGRIVKFGGIAAAAITTSDCTVTVAVNGASIGTFTFPVAAAAAGQLSSGAPLTFAGQAVNEDDVISFAPSGASGTAVPASFFAALQTTG